MRLLCAERALIVVTEDGISPPRLHRRRGVFSVWVYNCANGHVELVSCGGKFGGGAAEILVSKPSADSFVRSGSVLLIESLFLPSGCPIVAVHDPQHASGSPRSGCTSSS